MAIYEEFWILCGRQKPVFYMRVPFTNQYRISIITDAYKTNHRPSD